MIDQQNDLGTSVAEIHCSLLGLPVTLLVEYKMLVEGAVQIISISPRSELLRFVASERVGVRLR